MPRPHLRVRIGFNSNPDDAAQDWTDVSEYVRLADGLDLSRGRADEFSSVEPGRASLVLKNDDGRFTFGNGASPYYPGVVPMKRIRIDASPDGGQTWFPRFDGHVDGWPVSWLSPLATQSVITITASDRLSRFGAKRQLMDPLAEELGTSSGQDSGWTLGSLLPYEEPVVPAPMPDATNTGCSGTLTSVSGDQTITTPGTVLENLNIAGRVIVQAANVTIRNCFIRGNGAGSSNTGLISAYYSSTVGLVVEDVTLAPATPSIWWTGILGHDYTARRVHAYNVVDGFGVYNTTTPTAPANVLIEGCYVHDLAYLSPDSNHGDNHTHNDSVQIQGNGGVVIRGSRLLCNAGSASNATSPYDQSCTGQAIGITPTVSTVTDVTIEDNWLDYGAQSITVAEGSKGASGITIRRNRFGRGQPLLTKDGSTARRPVIVDPDVTAPGLPATTGADTAGNVYDDNEAPITITRTNSY